MIPKLTKCKKDLQNGKNINKEKTKEVKFS